MQSVHVPVMMKEVLDGLQASRGGRFLDCTLGGGGHSGAILAANPENTVFAIDRDVIAVNRAKEKFADEVASGRMKVVHSAFSDLEGLAGLGSFDGVLADLGISSDQLAEDRGFSFNDSGALDMRMDSNATYSAKDVVNNTSEHDLYVILKRGGVGVEARAVAREIVKARPLETTAELARAVRRAATGRTNKGFDPATVSFQAIRIEVNHELDEIESLLATVKKVLNDKGRFVVISFHSLEDKIVAKQLREWAGSDTVPANWPGIHTTQKFGKLLTKKAISPSEVEMSENSRSRSARLRVFERC